MTRWMTAGLPAIVIALMVGGCWHEEMNHDLTRPANPLGVTGASNAPVFAAKYLVVATDGEGNLNIFGDDGSGTHNYGAITIQQAAGSPLPLGDVHIHNGRAFVVISSGLKDSNDALTGGGVAIVDLAKVVANIGDATAVEIVPLVSNLTAKITRVTNAGVEPSGNYLWLSNAGPDGDSGSDSMFRLNWNTVDVTDSDGGGNMDDKYKDVTEVLVGHGDKRVAFSHAPSGAINAPLQVAACNVENQTLSIVGNDHMGASFLTLAKTLLLGGTPGGVGYSQFSGKFYIGMSSGATAMTVVTATPVNGNYTVANIATGTAANEIPVGGSVHVSTNGEYVYALGYDTTAKRGAFSIVEANLKTGSDAVIEVVDLGDVAADEIRIATVTHNMMTHPRLLLPATSRGGVNNAVLALDLNPNTGKTMMSSTPTAIAVGAGQAQRGIAVTKDHLRAYTPNGGDCDPTPGPDCSTIAVLDVAIPAKVTSLTTRGTRATAVAVIDFADLGVQPPPASGGGGGHQH